MELQLSPRAIDEIVYKLRIALRDDLAKLVKKEQQPEMVTTSEAAAILHVTPDHMRHIAHRYPHTKTGEGKQARLLFVRSALLQ
ncbi:MAG: hypothetical protein IKQ53_06695 [Bacteroidales bacterium]|nr:hypothetical protein [Bacteroidales bacterium]